MFRDWLSKNKVEDFDFSAPLFPKAKEREYWQSDYAKNHIPVAEKYLGFDWPTIKATDYIAFKTEDSRTKQEDPHFARRIALNALFLGELAEYKGRFIPDLVNGIFAICEETYWGLSAHFPPANYRHNIPAADDGYIDLYAAETVEELSIIYYMLYDELYEYCPEILTRIEYEIERRIIKSYLTHRDWFWQGYYIPINNWNPWIISNVLTAFLIVEKNKTVRDEGLRKMLFEIDNIYQPFPDDGGCDEGTSYWGASVGGICEFCEQLYSATKGKIDFFGDSKLNRIAKYAARAYIGGDYIVNFADGGNRIIGVGRHNSGRHNIVSYIYGKHMKDELLLSFAAEITNARGGDIYSYIHRSHLRAAVYKFLYIEDMRSHSGFTPEETFILPDLQNSFIRNGKWYYASKGGNNAERHNHNDVGSFIAYYENEPVLVDPSCGVYNAKTFHGPRYEIWTSQSAWHNTPVINGIMQKNGEEYRADSFTLTDKRTDISFAAAYPKEAGIGEISRSIDMTENGIEISDRFEFENSENILCQHFITPLGVEITENGAVIGGKFLLCCENGEFLLDSVDFDGDPNLTGYWDTDKMNRIILKFRTGKTAETKIYLNKI